ncbi:ABC transporter permease [Paenibacillus senegalimassiliensis]|uniref:ABC transporter permease n=1 Tax=Paenibacillus senegalimassiliensis TaxID=1737426 RepID=UPI00073F53C3|nr:ABC transporter permease [Paenibacillus senegalimassiliensis]
MSRLVNALKWPRRSKDLHGRRPSSKRKLSLGEIALGAALPIAILAVWQVLSDRQIIDDLFMPSPLVIASTLVELVFTGQIFGHLGISLWRAAIGFLIGGGLGLVLGLLVGFSKRTEEYVDPSLQLLRLTPNLALAPLFILWFGFGEISKIVIIANIAFFPLYMNAYAGIRHVDPKLVEVSRVLEFSRIRQVTRLILPATVPNLLLGLRLSLASSWLGLVVAEIIGSQEGIGYLITFGQSNNRTDIIFAGILIFALIGKLVDSFVRWLERRLLTWQDSFKG